MAALVSTEVLDANSKFLQFLFLFCLRSVNYLCLVGPGLLHLRQAVGPRGYLHYRAGQPGSGQDRVLHLGEFGDRPNTDRSLILQRTVLIHRLELSQFHYRRDESKCTCFLPA